MKKETIIRQNPCDREFHVLLTGCFFLFMTMELLGRGSGQSLWADRIVRTACLAASPGHFLLMGYVFYRNIRTQTEEKTKAWLLSSAAGCGLIFLFLAFGQAFAQRLSMKESLVDILTAVMVPSVSKLFCSLTVLLILVRACFGAVKKTVCSGKFSLIAGVLCLLTSMLQAGEESYTFMAVLLGTDELVSVPVFAYFAYFLAGAWLEREKPAFALRPAIITLAVTGGAVGLYLTALRPLALVLLPAFPLYMLYVAAEAAGVLTLRFSFLRKGCGLIWPVFWIGSVSLFLLRRKEILYGADIKWLLLLAVLLIVLICLAVVCWHVFIRVYEKAEQYIQYRVKHKTAVYFLVFTAAFSVVLFAAFFEYFRTGTTFIIRGDGVVQYFPRIIYFSRYIRELFAGLMNGIYELPMYDFSIGMGTEVTYSLEPLYFLYALFSEEHLEFAYSLVTLLRFYFAGISMSVLCLYFRKGYFQTFLASVVYVISGFALYGGVMHTNFMIPMILLPLQILAIEEILRGRKWQICTIVTAVGLFSNYYFLYMNTIAMGIYFLVRFFCRAEKEQRTWKVFLKYTCTICGSYLLGVGMSCIVLATTFGMYLGSGRSGALIKTPSLFYYSADWLISCFMTALTAANSPGEWLKLGYLPIAMFAVVFLFLRKERRELKIFTVLAVLFMAFPLAGFVFSGFSTVTNRWCYMAALLVAYIVAECYEDIRCMNSADMKVCGVLTAVYGFLAYYGTYKSTRYTKYAFWILAATLVILVLCQVDRKMFRESVKKGMLLVLTFATVAYQGFSLYHMDGMADGFTKQGEALEMVLGTPLAAVEELDDDSFYRVSDPKARYNSSNASMIAGYNSNTLLCSVYNGYIMEYLEKMGCTSYTSIRLSGMNNRTWLNNLAAVKYYGVYGKKDTQLPYGVTEALQTAQAEKTVTLYENEYALPIGYTYETVISQEELEAYPVVQRQEVLMQSVLLNDKEADTAVSAAAVNMQNADIKTDNADMQGLMVTSEELAYEITESKGLRLEDGALTAFTGKKEKNPEETHKMTLTFESFPEAELYLVLNGAYMQGDMSEQSVTITAKAGERTVSYEFRPDDYKYHTGQEDYVINLGYFKDPVTSCELELSRDAKIQLESMELWCQPMEQTKSYTEKLTEAVLEDVTLETNRVSGKISLKEDRILTLSIPYQKGWTAYVDGQETEILRANYMYMAIPLEAGDHTVELNYEIPGVFAALWIMAGSAAVFVLLSVVLAVRKRIKKIGQRRQERKNASKAEEKEREASE